VCPASMYSSSPDWKRCTTRRPEGNICASIVLQQHGSK
jgi:hypothetical protein